MSTQQIKSDVLVIGAGLAGIPAAIEASDAGQQVTIISKGSFGRDNAASWLAGWGFQAALYAPDSPEVHARDTIRVGQYLNNQQLVYALTSELPNVVKHLSKWLLRYKKVGGRIVQVRLPGETYGRVPQLARPGVAAGYEYRRVLPNQVKKRPIQILSDFMVVDLLVSAGQVVGAVGLNIRTGEFLVLEAKAVVLATGGFMGLYKFTTTSPGLTGDGVAMAYRAGVKLRDIEFADFYTTALVWPPILAGECDDVVMLRYDLGGRMLNARGVEFWEYARKTKKIAQAVITQQEIRAGRHSSHGGVYLSFRHLPENLIDDYLAGLVNLKWLENFQELGLDIRRHAFEVAPAPLSSIGGCAIDEHCATNLPGLFVAGETSGGAEGAYTLAGNPVCLYFASGFIAGRSAARWAQAQGALPPSAPAQVDEIIETCSLPAKGAGSGPTVLEIRRKIQQLLDAYLSLLGRTKENLHLALEEINSLQKMWTEQQLRHLGRIYNLEWVQGLENRNALLVLEMLARSALMREESRGLHFREDFPEVDNVNWLKVITVQQKGEAMELAKEEVAMPYVQPAKEGEEK
jgi:succinate dehydrogenase/fumarate reductase flavoprotein subunit